MEFCIVFIGDAAYISTQHQLIMGEFVMRSCIILDIETTGYPFETLDQSQRDYLLKFAYSNEEREEEIQRVNLYPYTASIVCIGMLNVHTEIARIHVVAGEELVDWESEDGKAQFCIGDECAVLQRFWNDVCAYERIVTFNGRMFDAPFLHVRSALLGVRSSRNLMPPRYNSATHYDLMEQLTFYHATRRFSLDFICTAFGIDSPKRHGVTGHDINKLVKDGCIRDIAEYNERDLRATRELYLLWMSSLPSVDRNV